MNDRLTNAELRAAIRETEKTCGMTVGAANKEACEHLATLRMVERNRATALIAAAGEGGDPALHENCVGVAIHNVVVDRIQGERDNAICRLNDRDAQIATLQAKVARLERQLEPLTEDEAREATGMMVEELGAKVIGNDGHLLATAYVFAADRIRARRGE